MFNPADGIIVHKPVAIIGKALDLRSQILVGGVYRDYLTRQEAVEHLVGASPQETAAIRTGRFPVFVTSVEGDKQVFCFVHGTLDEDLVEITVNQVLPHNFGPDTRQVLSTVQDSTPVLVSKFSPFVALPVQAGVVIWDVRHSQAVTVDLTESASLYITYGASGDQLLLLVTVAVAGPELQWPVGSLQLRTTSEDSRVGYAAGVKAAGTWLCRAFITGGVYYWDIKPAKTML